MRGGVVWSHLLASILGGLVVAGVLLAFGEVGKQRTETVPVPSSSIAPADASGSGTSSATEQIYTANGPGVVLIKTQISRPTTSPFILGIEGAGATASGSGFLISRQGFILTTYHEIEGADLSHPVITVEFNSQTSRPAEVIREQPSDDVALLKVNMRGVSEVVQALTLGNSRTVSVGSAVLSLANPFGLQRTLSSGVVAAEQPQLNGAGGMGISNVLQTDMPSSPGADGGPLMDADGDVIGINSQIDVDSGGSTYAVGFAVPIDTAKPMVPTGVLP